MFMIPLNSSPIPHDDKVHNAPGDDIAVVMCGYEEQIKKMLLDQNPGLQRRFPLASAFLFEDFSDSELRQAHPSPLP